MPVYVAYTAAAQAVPSTVALYNSQAVQLVYYMQQQPVQLEHIAEENTMLRSQVATLQSQLQYSVNRLQDLVQPPSEPVSRDQNAMFRSIPRQYLHNNPSGIHTVQNSNSFPSSYLALVPIVGSATSSPRTVRD